MRLYCNALVPLGAPDVATTHDQPLLLTTIPSSVTKVCTCSSTVIHSGVVQSSVVGRPRLIATLTYSDCALHHLLLSFIHDHTTTISRPQFTDALVLFTTPFRMFSFSLCSLMLIIWGQFQHPHLCCSYRGCSTFFQSLHQTLTARKQYSWILPPLINQLLSVVSRPTR